jgi:hypothetical protein
MDFQKTNPIQRDKATRNGDQFLNRTRNLLANHLSPFDVDDLARSAYLDTFHRTWMYDTIYETRYASLQRDID